MYIMSAIRFNTEQNHPLIDRQQTYFLEKKHITIHSEDRDLCKWSNSNQFEVILPRNLLNVISLKLVDITIPSTIYTFSNNNQNTKFRVTVSPQINTTDPASILEFNALNDYFDPCGNNSFNNFYEVTIDEGCYTPTQLANEIQGKLNRTISQTLFDLSFALPPGYIYDDFVVQYNPASHKLEFINNRDHFVLLFNEEIPYEVDCKVANVWNQTINWGFPYYIGFEKKEYVGLINTGNYYIDPIQFVISPSPFKIADEVFYVKSEYILNLKGDDVIYMELDKYNSIDEIVPYSYLTNNVYLNDYSGKTNSAFAKISLSKKCSDCCFSRQFMAASYELNNTTVFKVPIQNIRKLKFRFRLHDGRLVDFKKVNFHFTIEACELIDEQRRYKIVNNVYVD